MRLLVQVSTLWQAVKQPSILYPAIFVFAWQATPSADSAMFYFYSEKLQFGPEFLGRVRTAGSIASLVGIVLYNTKFKYVKLKTMFRWCAPSKGSCLR
jgi:BT1 family